MLSLTLRKSASEGSVPDAALDACDIKIDGMPGLVQRPMDSFFCGPCTSTRKCVHCSDLDSYDPQVLASYKGQPPIKFLSVAV